MAASISKPTFLLRLSNILKRQTSSFFATNTQISKTEEVVEDSDELDALYQRLLVECKGNEPAVLESYEKFIRLTAEELNLNLVSVESPPKVFERWTVLKSAHVHKKHRAQYETRTFFKNFEFKHITGSTADTLLEYIQRQLPEGIVMKVSKEELFKIPENFSKLKERALDKSHKQSQE
ncbi:DgyrCDS10241 [Dimorphilus gyrociliatus]|uniref:Small ribosomal subunit protein uS10m n=1 Tax=Dimorphilus gyrociliatus TaxID=2664684 RepID=A0A7I8W108_9ANNE|nr:DgyrCDS10241 [Dimorphilus gyrociliatus]